MSPLNYIPARLLPLLALISPVTAQEKTTYDDQVFPIFQQSCLNCHNPDKTKGGLDLSSFSAAMKGSSGGKVVEPGDVGSTLISCVQHTGEHKMPPEGEKLPGEQIEILKRWISGGLLENKTSSARKASKPLFETTLRTDPAAKPSGPPPMPEHLLLEPVVVTERAPSIHSIAASPWAPVLAVTAQHQVLLFHTGTLELLGILPFPEGDPISLNFTPDGRYLIVGGGIPGKSGVTVTCDIIHGTRLLTAAKEFDSILASDIRPGFDLVATGGPSRLLKLWNTESGSLLKSIKKHTDWITALDFSPDGVLLASGDRNGGVWVWESESCSEFHTIRGHQAAITAVSFRADSNLLATASEDGTVRFWEMNGGSEVKKIDAHPGGVTTFAFGRDGSYVTAGRDLKAKLWKPDFKLAREIPLPALPTSVALNDDGSHAFIADAAGIIHAFQTTDGSRVGEIQANPPAIQTRLIVLDAKLSSQKIDLSAAERILSERTSSRDSTRASLEDAEKSLAQAIETEKAAQVAATQDPSEKTAKMAAEAKARIAPAEQAASILRKAAEEGDKSVVEAAGMREANLLPISSLQVSIKHWKAAAINTQVLATRREAEENTSATEEHQIDFAQSIQAVTTQTNVLNQKRNERNRLLQWDRKTLSPDAIIELNATLAALDISFNHQLDILRKLEDATISVRQKIDETAMRASEKKQMSNRLLLAYHKLIE